MGAISIFPRKSTIVFSADRNPTGEIENLIEDSYTIVGQLSTVLGLTCVETDIGALINPAQIHTVSSNSPTINSPIKIPQEGLDLLHRYVENLAARITALITSRNQSNLSPYQETIDLSGNKAEISYADIAGANQKSYCLRITNDNNGKSTMFNVAFFRSTIGQPIFFSQGCFMNEDGLNSPHRPQNYIALAADKGDLFLESRTDRFNSRQKLIAGKPDQKLLSAHEAYLEGLKLLHQPE